MMETGIQQKKVTEAQKNRQTTEKMRSCGVVLRSSSMSRRVLQDITASDRQMGNEEEMGEETARKCRKGLGITLLYPCLHFSLFGLSALQCVFTDDSDTFVP